MLLSDFLWNAFEMHLTNGQIRRGQKRKPCAQLKPLYSHAVAALLVVLVLICVVVVVVVLECVPERPSDLSSPHRTQQVNNSATVATRSARSDSFNPQSRIPPKLPERGSCLREINSQPLRTSVSLCVCVCVCVACT